MLNRHRWETFRTEDGKPYLQCQRCSKDGTDTFGGTKFGPEFDEVAPRRATGMLFFGGRGGGP